MPAIESSEGRVYAYPPRAPHARLLVPVPLLRLPPVEKEEKETQTVEKEDKETQMHGN